ncbi:MAG TPA: hypothetical protein VFV38_35400 [Ktedonobacteraceae bacterium]|nr:hypothetical protein [Ktedonobacteraceae bacterium]
MTQLYVGSNSLACTHFSPLSICSHSESVTARDQQRLLPPDVSVQKSLSLLFSQQIVLVSGIGDFRLERRHVRAIARLLSLSAGEARNILIHPPWLSAEITSGVAGGMVSPFSPPDFVRTVLFAAVLLLPPSVWLGGEKLVAISLSLRKSLLFPADPLPACVAAYGLRSSSPIPVMPLY